VKGKLITIFLVERHCVELTW